MSLFFASALILLLLVTTLLFRPLWQGRTQHDAADDSPALRILREQRAELARELASGALDADTHARHLAELEARALAEAAPPDASPDTQRGVPQRRWALALAVLLPTSAVLLYLSLGNLQGLDPALSAAAPAEQAPSAAQIDDMVIKLAERVKAQPDDLEGLNMLGRSYMVLGRYSEAADTFARLAQRKPDASAYADWADALAGQQNRSLEGEPEKLIRKALKLDPDNLKALALSGTLAFERKEFKRAIRDWEKIAARVPPESEFGESVQAMLNEARQRAGLAPKPAAADASPLHMRGMVNLAPALSRQAQDDDTVFLFARPAQGGPPFAGMRYKVRDLPISFDFSQAQRMMGAPDPAQKVIIGARISKRGNAKAQTGDLQGFSPEVRIDTHDIRIEINELVR